MEQNHLASTFNLLRTRLRIIATSILGNDDDAQDAIQDAFYKLWKGHSDLASRSEAERLSVTAVKNASIDLLRRRTTSRADQIDDNIAEEVSEEASEPEREEVFKRVKTIIDMQLSERQRTVLMMRDMEDLSFREIAERLNMSEENVRMTLSRTRKIVRNIYQNMNYD